MILSNFLHKFSQTRGLGGGEQFLAYLDILLYSWDRCWPILIWIFSCKLVSKKSFTPAKLCKTRQKTWNIVIDYLFSFRAETYCKYCKTFFSTLILSWFLVSVVMFSTIFDNKSDKSRVATQHWNPKGMLLWG